ncbi:FUSC family protein [Klenkia brasiliensis]|uniref:FUSC family protein n=1 Tax=Klenkia brasiliensis TaxID=333142 RepID=UPI0013F60A4D|nr:FUSC family protein [Klenkia brasiliensis]
MVTPQSGLAPTAVRAGLSVGIPVAVLAAVGRTDLAIYATFGAFTAIYGRRPHGPADVAVQARHAGYLVAAVACGALVALSPDRVWWAVPVTGLWAAFAAWASDRQSWRPPGPLFCVFAVGACSSVALTSLAGWATAVLVAAVTAVVALALSGVGHLLPYGRTPAAAPAGPATATGQTAAAQASAERVRHRRRVQALRCAAAVIVAGAVGKLIGDHPYWAMVAAVAPMGVVSLHAQLVRGAHRGLGTLAGLGVAALALTLPLNIVGVVVAVVCLQVVTELVVTRNYGAAMLTVTPLALLLGQLAHPVPISQLLLDRGLETVAGVLVGIAVVIITRDRWADPTLRRGDAGWPALPGPERTSTEQ